MKRLTLVAVACLLSVAPVQGQLTAGELNAFRTLPAQTVTGEQVQTLWLRGFMAGLRVTSQTMEGGHAREVVDAVYKCVLDYSYRTILSLFADFMDRNPESKDQPAKDAVWLALLQHCSR